MRLCRSRGVLSVDVALQMGLCTAGALGVGIKTPESEWPARSCVLSSIAVAPETSGNGLGKTLIRAFVAQARSMDAQCVYLTTDADGNDAVNAFYREVGFQPTRRFLQRKGRWMNEYVISGTEAGKSCDTHP